MPVALSSAAVDPYADPADPNDPREKTDIIKLHRWVTRIHHDIHSHRSPLIVAEVILGEMADYAQTMRHPDRLHLTTAILLLDACTPALQPALQDMVRAAMHELLPALFFTRAVRESDAAHPHTRFLHTTNRPHPCDPSAHDAANDAVAAVFQRRAYAESFHDRYAQYREHTDAIAVFAARDHLRETVLHRFVLWLRRVRLRLCFMSWRQHSRMLYQKKLTLQTLVRRHRCLHMLPHTVRVWRQYAHMITLQTKMSRHRILEAQLDALAPVEQAMQAEHTRAQHAVVSAIQQLDAVQRAARETDTRYQALVHLHRRTRRSLQAHRRTWQTAVALLFCDAMQANGAGGLAPAAISPLPKAGDEAAMMPCNMTDTAAMLARRARMRTERLGLRHVRDLLYSVVAATAYSARGGHCGSGAAHHADTDNENEVDAKGVPPLPPSSHALREGVGDDGEAKGAHRSRPPRMNSSSPPNLLPCRQANNSDNNISSSLTNLYHGEGVVAVHDETERPARMEEVMACLRAVCWPVLPPLLYEDVMQSDQHRLNLAMQFVQCVYGGGHCSLFIPPACLLGSGGGVFVWSVGGAAAAEVMANGKGEAMSLLQGQSLSESKSVSMTQQRAWPKTCAATSSQGRRGGGSAVGMQRSRLRAGDTNDGPSTPGETRVKADKSESGAWIHTLDAPSCSSSVSDEEEDDEEDEEEDTETDYSGRMMSDVAQHLDNMHTCVDSLEQYLLSVRRCMSGSELERLHNALVSFYRRWSVLGVPLCREKVEAVVCSTVRQSDRPVVSALYPQDGIQSSTELAHYLTRVEEFTSWPILAVVDKLACQYTLDPVDETRFVLAQDEVRQCLRQRVSCMGALYRYLVDDKETGVLSRARTQTMMVDKFGLTETEAVSVYEAALRLSSSPVPQGKGLLGRDEMEALVYVLAQTVNPSPFCSSVEKLTLTLDLCACFLKFNEANDQ